MAAQMSNEVLSLTRVAELDVSAASGLCLIGDELVVVADDENCLLRYGRDGSPRTRVPLLTAELPHEPAERKRRKADFEALTSLPDGRLLVLGSGSTPARMRGAVIDPRQDFAAQVVDLAPLYAGLQAELPELNVEGAVVLDQRLLLLQRGNGSQRVNACIELDLHAALATLDRDYLLAAAALRSITRVELGTLDGVALSFTDACAHPRGGLLFSAAAEDTSNSYDDGHCAGSIVGMLSPAGRVSRAARIEPTVKVEGIACTPSSSSDLSLWLVTDADDPEQRATLFRAELRAWSAGQ